MCIYIYILVFFFTGEILALQSNPCPWKVFALVLCEDPPTPLVAWTVHRPSSTPNNRTNRTACQNKRKIPGTMGNNGGKQETQKKNDAFFGGKSIGVYILHCSYLENPFLTWHIFYRGCIFSYGKHGSWESPFWRCK